MVLSDWVHAGNAHRRRQALQALPGVLGWLLETQGSGQLSLHPQGSESPHLSFSQHIGQLIDEGQPWTEILAQGILNQDYDLFSKEKHRAVFKAVRRGIKRVERLPDDQKPTPMAFTRIFPETKFKTGFEQMGELLWMLGTVEMIDFPSTEQNHIQWFHMHHLMTLFFCDIDTKILDFSAASRYRATLRGILHPSDSPPFPYWLLNDQAIGTLQLARYHVYHWACRIFCPVSNKNSYGKISSLLGQHLTFKQLQQAQLAFHRLYEQTTQRATAKRAQQMKEFVEDPHPLWTAEGPEISCFHGVTVRSLQHPLALLKEGEEMAHCVAGYSRLCFQGTSRIFSFHCEQTGERATLEIRQKEASLQAVVQQFFGHRNSPPSHRMKAACGSFLQPLNDTPAKRWPRLAIPEEWEEQNSILDETFYQQSRTWFSSKHPMLTKAVSDSLEGLSGSTS